LFKSYLREKETEGKFQPQKINMSMTTQRHTLDVSSKKISVMIDEAVKTLIDEYIWKKKRILFVISYL